MNKRLVVLAVICSFMYGCSPAYAATTSAPTVSTSGPKVSTQLSWNAPTTREDGSALVSSDLKGYVLEITVNSQTPKDVNVQGLSYTDTESFSMGQSYTINYKVKAVDNYGLESPWSKSVSVSGRVVPSSVPSAPTGVVTIQNCTNCTIKVN